MNNKIGIEPDEFLKDYYNIVYKLASKFKRKKYYEDVIQEGMVGLVEAYHAFEPSLGYKFSSFAYKCVYGKISHYYRDKVGIIKKPRYFSEIKVLIIDEGYTINDSETIANKIGCSINHVENVILFIQNCNIVYADKIIKGGEGDEEETMFEKFIGNYGDYTNMYVDEFISKLSGNTLKFVILSMQGYKRVEIAKMMNFSQPMASKYARKAKEKWKEYNKEVL